MVYESLIVVALLFLGAAIGTLAAGGRVQGAAQWSLQALLLALTAGYFIASWHRGGQTVAMRAWRLRATRADGAPLSIGRASFRFVLAGLTVALACAGAYVIASHPRAPLAWLALAPFVASVVWGFFDAHGRFLYDVLSGTRLVHERKPG